jgi:hypothetical protein
MHACVHVRVIRDLRNGFGGHGPTSQVNGQLIVPTSWPVRRVWRGTGVDERAQRVSEGVGQSGMGRTRLR